MPTSAATARGGRRVVAGEQHRAQAERAAARATASALVGLTVSATTKTARAAPSQPAATAVWPRASAAAPRARRARRGSVHRPVGEQRRAADDDARARRRRPRRRGPRGCANASTARQRAELARAAAAIARAIGCSEACSSAPTSRSASSRVDAVGGDDVDERSSCPVVTVPVLSSTIVSTRRVDSRTSGPLIRMPSCAPRPVPTSSAVGVARPSAHGQAMISTATAAVNANVALSPAPSQKPSVATAMRDHDRDEDAGDAVGEPLHRRLAGLRVGRRAARSGRARCRRRRVVARDDQAPAGVDGRARDRVARADLDRDALAGEQRQVDGRACPRRRRRRWRPSRPGGRRSGRRPASSSIGTRRSLPSGVEDRDVLGAELEQRPQRGAGAALGARLEVAAGEEERRHDRRRPRGRSGRRRRRRCGISSNAIRISVHRRRRGRRARTATRATRRACRARSACPSSPRRARFFQAARWNGQRAPEHDRASRAASDSHCQLSNCSAGIIAISSTGSDSDARRRSAAGAGAAVGVRLGGSALGSAARQARAGSRPPRPPRRAPPASTARRVVLDARLLGRVVDRSR